MTAPVSQEKADGMKIAMTAPVTQEKAGDQYTIQFMMPSEYSLEELPAPNDSRITIRESSRPELCSRSLFGHLVEAELSEESGLAAVATLRAAGYEPSGEPIWARYDAPFKPWFLRRNEILTAFQAPVVQR